jgi:two-component system nitrogen regulation response regulator GlnG
MKRLLVIDDDPLISTLIRHVFATEHEVLVAPTLAAGQELLRTHPPDVVLLDVRLPDGSGLDFFQALHARDATIPVVFITATTDSEQAIEATKLGCFDYLVKPLDVAPLKDQVGRALQVRRMMIVPVQVDATPLGSARGDTLVGRSPAMQDVFKAIGRVAPTDVTVLIRGESGTGKELVARAVYQHSKRAGQPFLAINCAAIPEALLESELFGHEKGAFTGADRQRIGKFEQCHGGTLFLDEIGDMPLALQAKILRVLQEQQFQRIGGRDTITTNVRLIAATHRDLERLVKEERFRADLFYRLNVFPIDVPAVRERGAEDLNRLFDHFLARGNQELGKNVQRIAPAARELLGRYTWPGNVREIQNVLQSSLLLAGGPVLTPEDLPRQIRDPGLVPDRSPVLHAPANPAEIPGTQAQPTFDLDAYISEQIKAGIPNLHAHLVEWLERALLTQVLQHTHGHQTRAAEILGITRGSLRFKLRALKLSGDAEPGDV